VGGTEVGVIAVGVADGGDVGRGVGASVALGDNVAVRMVSTTGICADGAGLGGRVG
jgi:hypothetical protein